MSTIRFELRTGKADKKGLAPIRLIYQISGQRKYFNTGLKLFPANWDAKTQKAVYIAKKRGKESIVANTPDSLMMEVEIREINSTLFEITRKVELIEKKLELDGTVYTSEIVINKLKTHSHPKTKKEEPSNLVFDYIDRYISEHQNTREKGSLTVYKTLKKHLENYQISTGKKVSFEKTDYSFFQSFQNYLIGLTKISSGQEVALLTNTTIGKQLSTLKTFLNYAKKEGIEVSEKYKDFKIKKENLEVIALTSEEFETLYHLDLSQNKRLEQVRDVFCFACSTGLRYSDLAQLKREHIKDDIITLTVKKTKEPLTIPITPYSNFILNKYIEHHKPLPIISNQKMNDYIKELCKLAEINEPIEIVRYKGTKREAITYPKYDLIGVHTGRKTFATLSLEKGMNAEEVMNITGHRDYQSFKRYVKVTEKRKKIVMLKAWSGNLDSTKLKVV